MKNYIDLHMHSKYSDDGEFTPQNLVKQCYEAGVKVMAIADHNSVKANTEASQEAIKYGIEFIPAIEADCTYNGVNLHLLGYGIDSNNDEIIALEKSVHEQEVASSNEKLELTNKLGFALTKEDMDDVSDNGVWTGEMFGEVLLEKEEYRNHEILKPYRQGGSRSDNPFVNFYWDFYAQGKPCYTNMHYPSLKEAINIINKAGGVAVLAHPGNNLKDKYELFDEMVGLGIQGVEAFSSYHSEEACQYFYGKAKEYNLLATSGSDYHGKTKPAISLGGSRCTIDHDETYQQLKQLKLI